MILTILDTETGEKRVVDSPFSAYWWACGNGSRDCNRAGEFNIETPCAAKRFLIIDFDDSKKASTDDYDTAEYTLEEFNSDYPEELVNTYITKEVPDAAI